MWGLSYLGIGMAEIKHTWTGSVENKTVYLE